MTVSEAKNTRFYHQEDIQQILQIAITRQAYEGEFSHAQLLEIAAELEISPQCLHAAEQEWLAQQGESKKRQAFNTYRRHKLRQHFGKYVIVNSFLVPLDLISVHHLSWSPYILLLWGLGLGLNAWNTLQTQGENYERAFQQWYRRHQLRQSINSVFNRLLKPWQP
ncbi:MAG: 2TM domain-containing protein [Chroococcidiopsidaceae cyanobacterium CP_BM_RX_35]|nr:2TM domain-containing protein [Chroococcidiopsidaceae cyanobacterium CP_BM_RX_35]